MSGEAVVIGGGLAGTLAMVALLDHVDQVTVVERDRFPGEPAFRKGVPQARHLHVLLSSGQRALDRLLPGTSDALTAAGAHRLENPRDMIAHRSGGWERRYHEGRHSFIICTRPLLDHVVRLRAMERAAASRTRVEVLEATDVTALLGDSGRVTGVRIRSRDGEREERELPAGLVVDASGRGSHSPDWLDALGHRAPRLETVDAGLRYATRMFRLPDPPNGGVVIQHGPESTSGGVLLPVENGAWLLTVGAVGGVEPPTDDDGFVEFATTLGHPFIHELVKSAEPLSPVFGFRATSNRRRHYDAPGAVPDGFVAVGDAACSFNPVYGQGMSVAAMGALALRETLAAGGDEADGGRRPGFAASAQRAVARTADTAWLTAVGADRPYAAQDSTAASRGERLRSWYFDRLVARAAVDRTVGAAFRDVVSLSAPPARLMRPSVVLRTVLMPRGAGPAAPPREVEPG